MVVFSKILQMQKILILQDLGIPQEKFDELISKIDFKTNLLEMI